MKSIVWIVALILTILAAIYQRQTGPNNPIKTSVHTGILTFPLTFERSFAGEGDCPVRIEMPDINVSADLLYRIYPGTDSLTRVKMKREGDKLVSFLPHQPPAGKLEYRVEMFRNKKLLSIDHKEPIVIRFRGEVPNTVMILHILLMFLALFFCTATGFFALFHLGSYRFWGFVTFLIVVAGGLVFGPIVQKYAFGQFWTGFPFGNDLTDNKTLIAAVAWFIAVVLIRKKYARWLILSAAIITLFVFTVPHSKNGSELNRTTGKIVQGNIVPFSQLF